MSRLDEIKARAEQVHWTSTSIEQAMARMASSAADVPWLISEVESLTAERDALAGLLAEFVDSEPCSLDHHGYCQSHGHLDEGECHMARARAALAEADTTDTQPADQEVSDE